MPAVRKRGIQKRRARGADFAGQRPGVRALQLPLSSADPRWAAIGLIVVGVLLTAGMGISAALRLLEFDSLLLPGLVIEAALIVVGIAAISYGIAAIRQKPLA